MHPLVACLSYPLAQDLLLHPAANPCTRVLRLDAVVLFADVAGFTPLSAALAAQGRAGGEELTHLLNTHFSALIALVEQFGGSVAQLGGDSFTALFPYGARRQPAIARRAIACALALQRQVRKARHLTTSAGTFELTMRAGLACGPLLCLTAGNPESQLIPVLAGSVLERAARAEQQAPPGKVVVHRDLLPGLPDLETAPAAGEFVRAVRLRLAPGPRTPLAPLPPLPAALVPTLAAYVHPAIAARLTAGQQGFVDEHRTVKALFVNFAGFDYGGDPQVAGRLQAYLGEVLGVVARYGGYLKEVDIGDKGSKFIVLFGAPLAHEDDAERALRCALDLRQLSGPPVRIGINTGLVYCGLVGGPTRRQYTAIGDAVNLAARLMEAAAPGQILATASTQGEAGGRFAWELLGPLPLKGRPEPVKVALLRGVDGAAGPAESVPSARAPLIGRAAELARVTAVLDAVQTGQGQILSIVAEAGLGKSRLGAEVIRQAGARGLPACVGECHSYGTASPYLVWQAVWQSFFGLAVGWPVARQIAHLEACLAAGDPQLAVRLPLLGTLLNLSIPDTPATAALDAAGRKTALEALLIDCLRARTRGDHAGLPLPSGAGPGDPAGGAGPGDHGGSPLLIVLDDCHWIDPLSQELLDALGRVIGDLPVLLLLLYRPPEGDRDPAARLAALPYFQQMRLAEFTAEEAARLIEQKLARRRAAGAALPGELVAQITDRAQGNPFFIEELLNLLADRGVDPADPRAVATVEVPASLQHLLLSRLDALGEGERLTAKVASVIGRVFKAAWLWGVAPELGAPAAVCGYLDTLSRLDITPLDKPAPELEYLFKHILTRDVAYESLAYTTRAQLHGAVGAYIERTYAHELDRWLDLLAYHYGHSGDVGKQRIYFRRAGEAAQAAYANAVAIGYYERLLPLLAGVEQVAVLLKLGQVRQLLGEWAAADALYQEALALAEHGGDVAAQAQCQVALGRLCFIKGGYPAALQWLEQARQAFSRLGDTRGLSLVAEAQGNVHRELGDYAQALACFAEEWRLDTAAGDERRVYAAVANRGTVYRRQHRLDEALACYREAIASATRLGDRRAVALILGSIGMVYEEQRDFARALAYHREQLQIASEIGDRQRVSYAVGNMSTLYLYYGAPQESLQCATRFLQIALDLRDLRNVAIGVECVANVFQDHPEHRALSERLWTQAIPLGRALGIRSYLGFFLQQLAELYAQPPARYAEAQRLNAEALDLLVQVGDKPVELRARLLAVQLRVALGALSVPAAVDELAALLPGWSDADSDRASIHYAIWRLDPAQTAHQAAAAALYRAAYLESHWHLCGTRYAELTGEHLPAPPPLPPLPPLVTRDPPNLDALLARVDQILAEMAPRDAAP